MSEVVARSAKKSIGYFHVFQMFGPLDARASGRMERK